VQEDTVLKNLALDLKKTNSDMFIQFCKFNDITNIQNDTFCQEMKEFDPESLIVSIVSETQKLFDYKPRFEMR